MAVKPKATAKKAVKQLGTQSGAAISDLKSVMPWGTKKDTQITASALAELLGVPVQRIGEYVARGRIVSAGTRGKYWLAASIKAYTQTLRDVAGNASPDLQKAKTALTFEQYQEKKLKNAELRGELVEASAVLSGWADILTSVRQGVLSITDKVKALVPDLTRDQEERIDQIIHDALHALADGDGKPKRKKEQ